MRTARIVVAALLSFALVLQALPAAAAGGRIGSAALLEKIRPGLTTAQQVKELLGEPYRIQRFDRKGIDAWNYWLDDSGEHLNIAVEIDDKGIVRTVERIRRYGP